MTTAGVPPFAKIVESRKPYPFKATPFAERQGTFSPDGNRVAYASDISGRSEIFVSGFPSGPETKVSLDGGVAPRWRGDGRELFFLSPDSTLMAVRVISLNPFRTSVPQPLFRTDLSARNQKPYAVAKDGQPFLMPVPIDPGRTLSIIVALDWTTKVASQAGAGVDRR